MRKYLLLLFILSGCIEEHTIQPQSVAEPCDPATTPHKNCENETNKTGCEIASFLADAIFIGITGDEKAVEKTYTDPDDCAK